MAQLSDLRTFIRDELADTSTGFFSDAILNRFINRAIRKIAEDADAYERITSFAAFDEIRPYRVPTDFFKVKAISFMNGDTEYPLKYLDIRSAMAAYNQETQTTIPSYFSMWGHTRSNQFFYIFPKPGASWTVINAPGAPTGAIAAGSGLSVGAYLYRVTFYNSWGESDGGTASSTVTTTSGNQQVSLSSIPTTTNTNVDGRRIYRTQVGGSVYFFLTQIADRSTTTTYTDSTADNALGPELVNENTANNIRLYYYAIPGTDLSDDADTPVIPSPDFDETLILYAKYLCFNRLGDSREAQVNLALYTSKIADIKELLASKHRAHFFNVWDNSIRFGGGDYPFVSPIPSTNANS